MNSLGKFWDWLANSRHQKTLAFLGAGLVVVVSAGWQLYQHFYESKVPAGAPSVNAGQDGIAAGQSVTATAAPGGTAVVAGGAVNVNTLRPEDASEILAHANRLKGQAWDYEHANNLANAETLLKESIEVLNKGLGPDSSQAAHYRVYLGSFYWRNGMDRGRFELSLKQALAVDEKTFGPDHRIVAEDLESLAKYYEDEKRVAEAQPLYQRALPIRERTEQHDAGPDSNPLFSDRMLLARIYYLDGKYSEAESLLERSVAELSAALRDNRLYVLPELQATLVKLALTYRDHDRYAESEQTYKRVVELLEKDDVYVTASHKAPTLAATLEDYAVMLRKVGRAPEAARLESRASKIRQAAK